MFYINDNKGKVLKEDVEFKGSFMHSSSTKSTFLKKFFSKVTFLDLGDKYRQSDS